MRSSDRRERGAPTSSGYALRSAAPNPLARGLANRVRIGDARATSMTPGPRRTFTDGERAALQRTLGGWFRTERRDLPWRRTRDPYAIWISEAMLQQTRVEAVLSHYRRFLARFPDVRALAAAEEDD